MGKMVKHMAYPSKKAADGAAAGLRQADYKTSVKKVGSQYVVYTNDPTDYLDKDINSVWGGQKKKRH